MHEIAERAPRGIPGPSQRRRRPLESPRGTAMLKRKVIAAAGLVIPVGAIYGIPERGRPGSARDLDGNEGDERRNKTPGRRQRSQGSLPGSANSKALGCPAPLSDPATIHGEPARNASLTVSSNRISALQPDLWVGSFHPQVTLKSLPSSIMCSGT